jgi:hypothetical protein
MTCRSEPTLALFNDVCVGLGRRPGRTALDLGGETGEARSRQVRTGQDRGLAVGGACRGHMGEYCMGDVHPVRIGKTQHHHLPRGNQHPGAYSR